MNTVTEQTFSFTEPYQIGWERYRARHPEVFTEITRIAAQTKDRGQTRTSMKLIFELLRGQIPRDGDSPFTLNNNWASSAARELIAERPDLASLFHTREHKS